jgi:tryptophanyl-tRNA synthetase
MEEPKEPEGDHLYQLYSLFAAEADREAMAELYRRGGFGYGEIKKRLLEAAGEFFAAARTRRAGLAADPGRIEAILAAGAAKARTKAGEVLARARRACGLDRAAPLPGKGKKQR